MANIFPSLQPAIENYEKIKKLNRDVLILSQDVNENGAKRYFVFEYENFKSEYESNKLARCFHEVGIHCNTLSI